MFEFTRNDKTSTTRSSSTDPRIMQQFNDGLALIAETPKRFNRFPAIDRQEFSDHDLSQLLGPGDAIDAWNTETKDGGNYGFVYRTRYLYRLAWFRYQMRKALKGTGTLNTLDAQPSEADEAHGDAFRSITARLFWTKIPAIVTDDRDVEILNQRLNDSLNTLRRSAIDLAGEGNPDDYRDQTSGDGDTRTADVQDVHDDDDASELEKAAKASPRTIMAQRHANLIDLILKHLAKGKAYSDRTWLTHLVSHNNIVTQAEETDNADLAVDFEENWEVALDLQSDLIAKALEAETEALEA